MNKKKGKIIVMSVQEIFIFNKCSKIVYAVLLFTDRYNMYEKSI